eukprot:scaffold131057_cov66-Phaeocystis_antarctica.AAC.2
MVLRRRSWPLLPARPGPAPSLHALAPSPARPPPQPLRLQPALAPCRRQRARRRPGPARRATGCLRWPARARPASVARAPPPRYDPRCSPRARAARGEQAAGSEGRAKGAGGRGLYAGVP